MDNNRTTLEQSLKAYRVLNTPAKYSRKQHFAEEEFSNTDYFLCRSDEKEKYEERLKEGDITICDSIKKIDGKRCNLLDLIHCVTDVSYKNIPKAQKRVVYGSVTGMRPIGERAWDMWGGFQVIDMDIKDEELAGKLKKHIFEKLYKCNWFLGVSRSSSGRGLHIYTKISIQSSIESDPIKKKQLYIINFRHKYSFVYLACMSGMSKYGYTKDDILRWLDLCMCKPQQAALIGYDPHPYISTHFFEDYIYVSFDNIEDLGHPDIDWVTYPDLKAVFKRWEWFEKDEGGDIDIKVLSADDPSIDLHNKVHYKHFERWRLANTLVKLYGSERGYRYLRAICTNNIKDKELQADCITALRHDKPIDPWAVNRLNTSHGFNIKLNISDESFSESEIFNSVNKINNPTIINESKYYKEYYITKDQFLGDIKYDLIKDFGRITLLEAGAGVGKTEMVKSLVDDGKKCIMVMPFTSTIKSKIESDPNWYYSYGNKMPRLDVDKGLSMTIDKFSHMNLMDIKANGFDYIFIDESHLLFQSEYRPVMSKVIEMIRNTEVPIVLMSGTPSGELVFFSDAVHVKVKKEDVRKKDFNVTLVDSPSELLYHMCKQMAQDIVSGKRVLFPTNKGTLYSKQIKAAVTYFLQSDHSIFEEVRLHYYKKSNIGEDFMNNINFRKTIADTQILLCSNYLSVGVDILDKFNFSIYFADLMMPQETEQFANRLRKNDLHINLFVSKNDSDGNTRSLHKYKEINFKLNEEELKNAHSILRLCNAMIERNPVEYKYNSLIASIIRDNKFIEYNDIENKYYLNDITYKVIYFERKYREYVQQLPVLMKGMMCYGYDISTNEIVPDPDKIGESGFGNLKSLCKLAYDEQLELNTHHIEELLDLITEERLNIYKEALRGSFEIKKGDVWKENLSTKKMTVKNIEVFEKVVPICLSLSKQYDMNSIREIFEYCRNKNKTFNFAAIRRIRTLVNIVYNDKNGRLDLPIKEYMGEVYEFSQRGEVHKNDIKEFIHRFTVSYAQKESTRTILIQNSLTTIQELYDKFEQIFKCLVTCSRPKGNGKVKMERVELLWKERDVINNETVNENNYMIEEFLGVINKKQD